MKYLFNKAITINMGAGLSLDEKIKYIFVGTYFTNDSTALIAFNEADERLSDISINVPESMLLDDNQFFLNDTNTAESFKNFAEENGYLKPIGMKSNLGYYAYELTDKFYSLKKEK
ncbi:hypothetical protein [Lactobacillus taiwanensis]|uniref:hypothetical protein n=1 Tax=Lactobacillus taiwanensis TaxID=508451 RepID=UPI00272CAB5D|nr:hypothetical protein [Lactobacillus taiwanensis]